MHDDRLPFPVERLLRPRSVAIVGISPDPGSMGHRALTNLRSHGFAGEVHLVSRSNRVVGGLTCAASIDDLPAGVDAMILALPAAAVPEAVESAARRGVGGIVAFAAGFGEAGEAGARRQARMADSAREAGMALLGPTRWGSPISWPAYRLASRRASQTAGMAGPLWRSYRKVAPWRAARGCPRPTAGSSSPTALRRATRR